MNWLGEARVGSDERVPTLAVYSLAFNVRERVWIDAIEVKSEEVDLGSRLFQTL